MKRILFLFAILSLVAVGCNRGEERAAGGGTGMQEEQQTPSDQQSFPADDANVEEVEPSMQEEDMQRMDETTPVNEGDPALESDPGMQEEQIRQGTDTSDNLDSSMGSGTDTDPEATPTDNTGIQQ